MSEDSKNETPPEHCTPSDGFHYSRHERKCGSRRLLTRSLYEGIGSMCTKRTFSTELSSFKPYAKSQKSYSPSADCTDFPNYSPTTKFANEELDELGAFRSKKRKLVRKADIVQRNQEQSLYFSSKHEQCLEDPTSTNDFFLNPSIDRSRNQNVDNGVEPTESKTIFFTPAQREEAAKLESVVLFFNTASNKELTDFTQCSSVQADILFSLRPFSNFSDLSEKIQNAKGLTTRIISNYLAALDSIDTLDDLITRCTEIQNTLNSIMTSWSKDLPQPTKLSLELKEYQKFGVAWLLMLYEQKLSGGILADDMGLGKTAQVIGFISSLLQSDVKGPHLIISPASTVEHWIREFVKWMPSCRTFSYHGSPSERNIQKYEIKAQSPDVIITTYNVASGYKDDRVFLRKLRFKTVTLDEGHKVKNSESQANRYLSKIPCEFRLLITGTPLQNNLHELVSLLMFIMPDVFAGKHNWQRILNLKSIDSVSQNLIIKMQTLMQPFVLRRKKIQVLHNLPPKNVSIITCTLESEQKKIYRSIQIEAFNNGLSQQRIQHYFMSLRKAASHPLLFRRIYSDSLLLDMSKKLLSEEPFWETPLDVLHNNLLRMSDFQIHQLALSFKKVHSFALENKEWMKSAKFAKLAPILKSYFEEGCRCLIFSQFTSCLDILEAFLTELNYTYSRLDGTTPIDERQSLVDEYNENSEIFIFLLSTRAAGLGLNLTGANIVILHDLDFNPHNDTQAEDRAWRLGQSRTVHVLKLICEGTVEEIIYKRQLAKLELDHRVTGNGDLEDLYDNEFRAQFLKYVSICQSL